MKVGVTGSRNGLTTRQLRAAREDIPWGHVTELHSGDCVGVDASLHGMAKELGVLSVGHPPLVTDFRAYCDFDFCAQPLGYFRRDRDIVDSADVVYAFPPTEGDTGRGGTWYTINYAIKSGKKLFVITPSGKVKMWNMED